MAQKKGWRDGDHSSGAAGEAYVDGPHLGQLEDLLHLFLRDVVEDLAEASVPMDKIDVSTRNFYRNIK